MINDEQITALSAFLDKEFKKIRGKQTNAQTCLERLNGIRMLPRTEIVPAVPAKTEEVLIDPTKPNGPKTMKITQSAIPETTKTVFDVMPKNILTDLELTEEDRDKIFESIKSAITAL